MQVTVSTEWEKTLVSFQSSWKTSQWSYKALSTSNPATGHSICNVSWSSLEALESQCLLFKIIWPVKNTQNKVPHTHTKKKKRKKKTTKQKVPRGIQKWGGYTEWKQKKIWFWSHEVVTILYMVLAKGQRWVKGLWQLSGVNYGKITL